MELCIKSDDLNDYLEISDIIDYDNPSIKSLAEDICITCKNDLERVEEIFKYVRDYIKHSADILGNIVTCKASDVLIHRQGTCYAKAHLLAALLRYYDIPTGFCYQRLLLSDEKPYLIIHGLNGVYLNDYDKWIRLDARGNKDGVNSEFSLEIEKLAFHVDVNQGEEDIMVVYAKPDSAVIDALNNYDTVEELFNNLPCDLKNR